MKPTSRPPARARPDLVPLRVSFELYEGTSSRLLLIPLDEEPLTLHRHWPDGLTPDVVDFISTQCRCFYCGSRITSGLNACSCGRAQKEGYALVAVYTDDVRETWLRIYYRESARAKQRRRQGLIDAGGGPLSADYIAQLLEVQERMCYFCAAPLTSADGRPNFHRDHFEPLAFGGASTADNIVLTCPRCNILKKATSGSMFDGKARKLRTPEAAARLKEMRKRLVKWRANHQGDR